MQSYCTTPNLLTWPNRLAQSRVVAHFTVPGEPLSKQRPKFTILRGGSVYSPKQTVDAEFDIQVCIKQAAPSLFPDNGSGFGVRCLFIAKTRQRRDIDNMIKLICDAANGMIWEDDRQVVELFARKLVDKNDPRTEVMIYKTDSLTTPKITCLICGIPFKTYPSWTKRRYCSQECMAKGFRRETSFRCDHCGVLVQCSPSRLSVPAQHRFCSRKCKQLYNSEQCICSQCGKGFNRARSHHPGRHVYCSAECAQISIRHMGIKKVKGQCPKCGGPISKTRYNSCWACRISRPASKPRAY